MPSHQLGLLPNSQGPVSMNVGPCSNTEREFYGWRLMFGLGQLSLAILPAWEMLPLFAPVPSLWFNVCS